MSSTKKYTISSIKQLIDLNGKSINFHLSFLVKSLSKEPFDALVVTQEMLDSNEPLNYQRADGEISGQIKSENGIYNNYFLCLKSDKPMEVEVLVNINELPANVQNNQQPLSSPQQQQQQLPNQNRRKKNYGEEGYYEEEEDLKKSSQISNKSNNEFSVSLLLILFLILSVIGLGVLYYYNRNSNQKEVVMDDGPKVDALIKDGFNDLGEKLLKLNETTSRVNEGLNDVTKNVTHNLHSGFDKLQQDFSENISSISDNISKISIPDTTNFSDLGEIKDSINNLKSLYSQNISYQLPPPVAALPQPQSLLSLDAGAVSNAEEVLSRLNSMKILNKQA